MKPGATIMPSASMTVGARGGRSAPIGDDAVAVDAHVGDEARRAGAVDDGAAAQEQGGRSSPVPVHRDLRSAFDHADGSTGCDSLSEPRSFSTCRTRLQLRGTRRPAAQPDAHHQDLEIRELRQIGLGADAHRRDRPARRPAARCRPARRAAFGLRDGDDHRALFLRHLDRVEQAAHAADVARSPAPRPLRHRGGRDQLQVRVEVRARRDAEPREARLRVARHEHRRRCRRRSSRRGAPRRCRVAARSRSSGDDVPLEIGQRADRALQDLVRDRLHVVAGRARARCSVDLPTPGSAPAAA